MNQLIAALAFSVVILGAQPKEQTLNDRVREVIKRDETGVFLRPVSRNALVAQIRALNRRIAGNEADIIHAVERGVYDPALRHCLAESIALIVRLHMVYVQLDDVNNERMKR